MSVRDWCFRNGPKHRPAEREAHCRACDGLISKGEMMVSMYSFRNRGQYIHFHPECVKQMAALIDEALHSEA